ncbi:hypothetical protein M758_3G033800 [Ceratodon purpureus]|nr:hypothetical protein M758_3G033800 [Ceratodon purpureus]
MVIRGFCMPTLHSSPCWKSFCLWLNGCRARWWELSKPRLRQWWRRELLQCPRVRLCAE